MTIELYKVCKVRGDRFFSSFFTNLEYKIGEWTRPVIPNSKLFIYKKDTIPIFESNCVCFLIEVEGKPVKPEWIMEGYKDREWAIEQWWRGDMPHLNQENENDSIFWVDAVKLLRPVARQSIVHAS